MAHPSPIVSYDVLSSVWKASAIWCAAWSTRVAVDLIRSVSRRPILRCKRRSLSGRVAAPGSLCVQVPIRSTNVDNASNLWDHKIS
jgi:hypothetical protein